MVGDGGERALRQRGADGTATAGGDDEDGAKPAAYDDSNYWYEAPTGDGPHGYIRIFSEVSANDRAHYADVIKAADDMTGTILDIKG